VQYARKRTIDHVTRFQKLYDDLLGDTLDDAWLAEVERRDNLFPDIDYRLYAT
jgi:1,4-alpha-glucan branching enzyme